MAAGAQTAGADDGKVAWISQGFEELLHERAQPGAPERVFDVLVVGSGYGGAVAAAELAGCTQNGRAIDVGVLERGREYLPGMLPSGLTELPLHVRFSTPEGLQPRGRRDGLFDVRIGPDVNAVVACGVGGGSLINAGVMERPARDRLAGWPGSVCAELFDRYYERAEALLELERIDATPEGEPPKLRAFRRLHPRVQPARLSVGLTKTANREGVALQPCNRCGDCATGCNFDAKNSLDTSLLVRAWRAGARIYTGATVLWVERRGDDWLVHAVPTEERMRKRDPQPPPLRARRVILAAGTFGSTEILLRSRAKGLALSPRLGERFSSNGDSILAVYDQGTDVNAVADERDDAAARRIGPTITGMLDLRGRRDGCGHVFQEIAVPAGLRRLFEETVTTVKLLHELAESDCSVHRPGEPAHDPCAVDAAALRRTSIFVAMGDDGAGGRLELIGGKRDDCGDGAVRVHWPKLREHELFASQVRMLQRLARRCSRGARVLPSPLWQLLPDAMQFLADYRRGPLLTVHPLGGCAMGAGVDDGVVDHLGRVFDGADPGGTRVHAGLVVLDGSIVRSALGINPALTITALALRAVEKLRAKWELQPPARSDPAPVRRPRFRSPPGPQDARPTEIAIVERMHGEAMLRGRDGQPVACRVELTLEFAKQAVEGLVLPPKRGLPVPMARRLQVEKGNLRVFRKDKWDAWRLAGGKEEELDDIVELRASLDGHLTLLDRERSRYLQRLRRALCAWWHNRGKRDIHQAVFGKEPGPRDTARRLSPLKRIRGALALASRGGEVRRFDYELCLKGGGRSVGGGVLDAMPFSAGARILGHKRLTYERRANPWRQLMEMTLERFPGLAGGEPVLELDLKYLAWRKVPLLKLAGQNDQVSALADLVSLLAYFLRLLLNVHMWSFRKPDTPPPRVPERLPGAIPGRLPPPAIDYVYLVPVEKKPPAIMRLTRYCPPAPLSPPVVLIHGYSASGTTFAHPAVKPNMAEWLVERRRDVWILDLRTSSGMPTATHPWAFEDAAFADIPKAIDEICRRTGSRWVDVFAHCMGSAMFTMAVLAPPDPREPYYEERRKLPGRVRRAVLSQIAPAVIMSPANVFRGYVMSYLRHFLPLEGYQFTVGPEAGLTDQLLDRLLATLPYPREEFDIENPPQCSKRTPFVGTRHRMDALYGRDFSLADKHGRPLIDDAVLEHIDDLFGPLSTETVAQAILFARHELIVSRSGRNEYVLPNNILRYWTFPTLSLHGAENGLADVGTPERFRRKFSEEAGVDIAVARFDGFGHQDCLIGKNAAKVFQAVAEFLKPK